MRRRQTSSSGACVLLITAETSKTCRLHTEIYNEKLFNLWDTTAMQNELNVWEARDSSERISSISSRRSRSRSSNSKRHKAWLDAYDKERTAAAQ